MTKWLSDNTPAWCPGCGNFSILKTFDNAVDAVGLDRDNLVLVSGIGQAAKFPHYTKCNCFNGLHGRALPAATGIKIANHKLNVVITSGDGDMYGEGGNHFELYRSPQGLGGPANGEGAQVGQQPILYIKINIMIKRYF